MLSKLQPDNILYPSNQARIPNNGALIKFAFLDLHLSNPHLLNLQQIIEWIQQVRVPVLDRLIRSISKGTHGSVRNQGLIQHILLDYEGNIVCASLSHGGNICSFPMRAMLRR